jgi:hypothetical protein
MSHLLLVISFSLTVVLGRSVADKGELTPNELEALRVQAHHNASDHYCFLQALDSGRTFTTQTVVWRDGDRTVVEVLASESDCGLLI